MRSLVLIGSCIQFASMAFAQGALAHIASGGGWQTTITLINLSAAVGNASVTIYSDSGAPLSVTALGQGPNSQFSMTVPANGAASLTFPNVGTASTVGWAIVQSLNGALLRGQGTFLYQNASGTVSQAVVPFTSSSATTCIIPVPPPATTTILLPFDDTGGMETALAIVNTSGAGESITLEVDDQNDSPLVRDSLNLASLNHSSFLLRDRYPVLENQKGVIRFTAATQSISILGLLAANTGGLSVSTLLPISQ